MVYYLIMMSMDIILFSLDSETFICLTKKQPFCYQSLSKDDSNFKRLVDQALENIEQDNNCYLGSGNQNFKNLQDHIIKN